MVKKNQLEWNDEWSSDSTDEKANSTVASRSCDHVKKAVDSSKLRKLLKTTGLVLECIQCQKVGGTPLATEPSESLDSSGIFEYDNTLWLCLKCGTQLCGRAKNQHALKHFKTPHSDSHALTINTRSFEIWCYECDNEVKADSRKNLLECVEFIKGLAQKPPIMSTGNIENKIINTLESLKPLLTSDELVTNNKSVIPLPPPPLPPIPGMAKRVNEPLVNYSNCNNLPVFSAGAANTSNIKMTISEQLPRVRGLTNLGNTCFFNAVMQCLAQTPFLLDVLKESAEPGEEFTLPGGIFKSKDDEVLNLPPIKGTLSAWGGLTSSLAQILQELQSGGGVVNPSKLFLKLCAKCPQFQGGDQHDSHELLRHLLESVRSEDLKRYQRVILQNLGYKDQDINTVSEDMKQKCKIYGNQAADRILRPEQVFRGFLVSTLICRDCCNVSSRHEYFLDMSLPVSVEKSQPPQIRRKSSPENANSFFLHPTPAPQPTGPTKAQLKKEQKRERKAKRAANHLLGQKQLLNNISAENDASGDAKIANQANLVGCATREENVSRNGTCSNSSTSEQQSDADVEDNLLDDNEKCVKPLNTSSCVMNSASSKDPNGNQKVTVSPVEKRGDSPENMDKDSLDEDENDSIPDSGIAVSLANTGGSVLHSSASNSEANGDTVALENDGNNSVLSLGLSEKGANIVRQLSLNELKTATNITSSSSKNDTVPDLETGEVKLRDADIITEQLHQLNLKNDAEDKFEEQQKAARAKAKRKRTQSNSDWKTTFAPYYKCEDGECSVQSCLNNFTAIELMTGNNKVGCESCTKRINGDDPKAKTVYTNATKQFLISSPPAVLILHLKRFQLGPRFFFRKLTRPVSFHMLLDIAPFCGSKVKNLPNIDRKQKKLLYALYGVVEHSGNMSVCGHYTAYVKVRQKLSKDDKRWKFIPQGSKAELDQDDEQRKKLDELLAREKARDLRMKAANDSDDFSNSCTSSGSSNTTSSSEHEESTSNHFTGSDNVAGAAGGYTEASDVQVPLGKWYYVSDSRVSDASESEVLNAQAYLLFYERIY